MTDKKLTVENFKKAEEKERCLLEDYGYKALSIERLRHREMMAKKDKIDCDCKYCMENPTCYKELLEEQLARKTKECEEKDERIIELTKEALSLKQECEELKKENKKLLEKCLERKCKIIKLIDENATKEVIYKINGKSAKTVANKVKEIAAIVEGKDCKYSRYRKALEEIEEYVKTTIRIPLERKVILNIIGNTKEENNGINDNSK